MQFCEGWSCPRIFIRRWASRRVFAPDQQPVIIILDRFVTLTGRFLEAWNVYGLDTASRMANEARALKVTCDKRDRRAPDAQNVPDKLLSKIQRVALGNVPCLKQPAAERVSTR